MKKIPSDLKINDTVTRAAINLFCGAEHGHMGSIVYLDQGANLFNQFTLGNPDYYIYDDEIDLFINNGRQFVHDFRRCTRAVIVGQGPASSLIKKELWVLSSMPHLRSVHFIDLSQQFNDAAKSVMRHNRIFNASAIQVHTHTIDFRKATSLYAPHENTAVLCTGSLISNLDNVDSRTSFPIEKTQEFMRHLAHLAGDNGKILLGYDANLNCETLLTAYNHPLEPFMLNIMAVIRDHANGASELKVGPEYFSYRSTIIPLIPMVEHLIEVKKSQKLELITETGTPLKILLKKGAVYSVMASLKPRPRTIHQLGQTVGMKTSTVYANKNGPILHIFDVT